ncbi:hypothetical protein D5086_021372 [Populus alba]|uniref:Uncharacterized protein n=1 Tax=Populus alba TaxID=43335 RepID=A0ACC4BBZ4_POPAL
MSRNQEQNHKANVGESYVSMYDKALNQYRSQKGVCKTNQESVDRSVAVFCLALVVCLVSDKIHIITRQRVQVKCGAGAVLSVSDSLVGF